MNSAETADSTTRCAIRLLPNTPEFYEIFGAESSKKKALIAHAFDSNFLLGEFLATDGAHVPLACGELPEKAAVALRRNSCTIHKPFHVAAGRCSEFDHLL